MTEKEYNAKRADLDVKAAELELRKARLALDHGYEKLKFDVEEATTKLAKETLWREWKYAEAETPFEAN